MLINEGNIQGMISEVQEGLIEQAADRGEMPVNVLSRHKSLSTPGMFVLYYCILCFLGLMITQCVT